MRSVNGSRRGGKTELCAFGKWIQSKLIEKGALQDDLGTALGLGKSSVTAIMSGKQGVKLIHFVGICDFFEVRSFEVYRYLGLKPPKRDRSLGL